MYSFSHQPNQDWLGEFETAQEALEQGRRQYGADTKIFVGRWNRAYYTDYLPDADELLSWMKERVTDELGDQYADTFDELSGASKDALDRFLRTAISEWEAELPDRAAFTGQRIDKVVGYVELEAVRVTDFGAAPSQRRRS